MSTLLVSKCPDIILGSGFVLLGLNNHNPGPQKAGLNATAAFIYHLDLRSKRTYRSFIFVKKNGAVT